VVDSPNGFVALKSLKQGPPADPAAVIAEIRTIYFKTTKKTIVNDLAHAIELLKSLPDEDTRDKAAVFMDGLQQMKNDWSIGDGDQGAEGPREGGRGKRSWGKQKRSGKPRPQHKP
jgi:hypothetical protein